MAIYDSSALVTRRKTNSCGIRLPRIVSALSCIVPIVHDLSPIAHLYTLHCINLVFFAKKRPTCRNIFVREAGIFYSVQVKGLDKIVLQKKKWYQLASGCTDLFTFVKQEE